MRAAIYTLGCKVNQYETQAMEQELRRRGHELVDFENSADAYIINTCSVTAVSDKKSRQMIRRARRRSPGAVVAACGCYVQTHTDEAKTLGIDLIGGTGDRMAFLDLLEQECTRQEKSHAVIIMADLGDLREGYWDHEEMVQTCLYVERRLPHVHLSGVGVNLSCYGSVRATPEKMQMLLAIARRVEDAIGRPLEIVSGGATSSYPMIHTGTMPAGINHLRIGENILTAQDIADSWGVHDADYLRDDVFRLEAEVVEVKEKPTYPQGELGADAFGRKPVYEDRGLRLRAILALGRADVGDMETLRPTMPGVTVIGGSSDHCILDVTDAPQPVQVGDVLSFRLCYSHVLYATQRDDVPVVICP